MRAVWDPQSMDNGSVLAHIALYLILAFGAYYAYSGYVAKDFDKSIIGGVIVFFAFFVRILVFPYLKKKGIFWL